MHTSESPQSLTFELIEQARRRIAGQVALTPFEWGSNLSDVTGCKLYFKLENLQITGSFKERGACNRLLMMPVEQRAAGVVAASAGNHAQGVALHATRLGFRSTIVMPEPTSLMKIARTRRYGAEVVLHGATYDDAYAHARELCEERGAVFIHPFDDVGIMAGQGTIGLEMIEQNPYLQTVIVPIGGGGLISGIAVAVKEANPRIRVIGVQTSAYPSMKAAVAAGHPVEVPPGRTIADGIAVRKAGAQTLDIVQRYVDDIVTVSEEEIASAILLLLEEEKVVAEGAAAAGLAALVHGYVPDARNRKTGLVICGGNIDTNVISNVIVRGLVKAGRRVRLQIALPDQPGALARLTRLIADERANILEIHHDRQFNGLSLGETEVEMTLETRGEDHIQELTRMLKREGYIFAR
jgi:threonine dehydratase